MAPVIVENVPVGAPVVPQQSIIVVEPLRKSRYSRFRIALAIIVCCLIAGAVLGGVLAWYFTTRTSPGLTDNGNDYFPGGGGEVNVTPSLTFAVLGDFGRNGTGPQKKVAKQMSTFCATHACDFVVSVGDNFYPSGVADVDDRQWNVSWNDVYTASALQIPWYTSLGNHDYLGNPEAQIAYSAVQPRWQMPARYYRKRVSNDGKNNNTLWGLEMHVLDTSPYISEYYTDNDYKLTSVVNQNTTAQTEWYRQQMEQPREHSGDWRITIGHHPIYSYVGNHDLGWGNPNLGTAIQPLLRAGNVSMYLCGHDHVMEHIAVPNDPTVYLVSGAGSQVSANFTMSSPNLVWSDVEPGFTLIKLTETTMTTSFVTQDGRVVHTFTTNKK